MANVLIDIPDEILFKIDKIVAKHAMKRAETLSLNMHKQTKPPPLEGKEYSDLSAKMDVIMQKEGIAAANKFAKDYMAKRAEEHANSIKVEAEPRMSRTKLVRQFVLEGFKGYSSKSKQTMG